jgi:predicted metal-dependent phosphoesterase TrpH
MIGVLRLDLHVHTTFSPDSRLPLTKVGEALGGAGLHGFALTDHNTVEGHRMIPRLREQYPGVPIIPGVEVTAQEGHVLVYGVTECPPRDRPVAELAEWASGRNAVVVLAHPFRWVHGVGRRVATVARVDGIEVQNGRNSEYANRRAELLAAQRGIAMTGGSDAHELATLGRSFTEFEDAPETVEECLELLRRGKCSAGGRSLSLRGRLLLSVQNAGRRVARGFRPV